MVNLTAIPRRRPSSHTRHWLMPPPTQQHRQLWFVVKEAQRNAGPAVMLQGRESRRLCRQTATDEERDSWSE